MTNPRDDADTDHKDDFLGLHSCNISYFIMLLILREVLFSSYDIWELLNLFVHIHTHTQRKLKLLLKSTFEYTKPFLVY